MDLVAIAVLKRAIGLEGYCGVLPHGETFARLKTPVTVYIGQDERRVREVVLEKAVLRQQGYAALFDIARDRTEAEKLPGLNVYVSEDQLPALEDGRCYHFHLRGMTIVSDLSGDKIGTVKDAVNLPSTDALEVTLTNGHEAIIPYNEQAVVKVDPEKRVITVSGTYIEELL